MRESRATRSRLPFFSACLLLCVPAAGADDVDPGVLIERFERGIPALLAEYGVPGAGVAVVHRGRVAYLAGFGLADAEERQRVEPDTIFNAGSISEVVTARAVMRLVEEGVIRSEDRVSELLPGLEVGGRVIDSRVTVVDLLSHTSGLGGGRAPELEPWEPQRGIRDWLASDPSLGADSSTDESGCRSGADYAILQLLIEQVTGEPFAAAMKRLVLEPLGMRASSFDPPIAAESSARPYDSGKRVPLRRHTAPAAAGLFTTTADLALFLESHSVNEPGHRGKSQGWAAGIRSIEGEGIVVLTNDTRGESLYRWVVCEWTAWLGGEDSSGNRCGGSAERREPEGEGRRDQELHEVVAGRVKDHEPGFAVLVGRGDEILLRESFGVADLVTGASITPSTPFYIASLAKPITSTVVLGLVADGELALDESLSSAIPEEPLLAERTLRSLLDHTSGLADYWSFVDWSRPVVLDDERAMALVAAAVDAREPANEFAYGNTSYVALARIVEALTGRRFGGSVERLFQGVDSTSGLFVLDRPDRDLPHRAKGYRARGDGFRVSDYRRLEVPGYQTVEPLLSTTGAGGLAANVDGLWWWARALMRSQILPRKLTEMMLRTGREAKGVTGLGKGTLAGLGLFKDELSGRRVSWHDGSLFGHQSLLIMEPDRELVVILLANSGEIDLRGIALDLLRKAP